MCNEDPYERLVEGVAQFQRDIHGPNREKFRALANGQSPRVLMVTCADSRVDPYLITSAEPGDIFVCRSIGNLLPPHGSGDLGSAAFIEYSLKVLKVNHIIVCGHSQCGAVRSLLDPSDDKEVPRVTAWLHFAEAALQLTRALVTTGDEVERLRRATELNIVSQLTNAHTYPEIATALALGTVTLHGWYYDIATGEITSYDPATNEFRPVVPKSS